MHKKSKIKHIKEVVFIINRLKTRIYINFNIMIIIYCVAKNQYLLLLQLLNVHFIFKLIAYENILKLKLANY